MSLTLLVAIVVVGIAAVVIAVHMTGGSRTATLADAAAARRRFAEDFPDIRARKVHLTSARNAAFLELDAGKVGMVQSFGGKYLTRLVAAGDLASTPKAEGNATLVRLRDFTWKGGAFEFETEAQAEAVAQLFRSARRTDRWEMR